MTGREIDRRTTGPSGGLAGCSRDAPSLGVLQPFPSLFALHRVQLPANRWLVDSHAAVSNIFVYQREHVAFTNASKLFTD